MIELNTLYKHYKTGNDYLTLQFCKMQQNNQWLNAVIYKASYDDGMVYVRELKDFEDKFAKVM